MQVNVLIPQQGLTSEIVTILEICKSEGDRVAQGDELLQMESEKASLFLESPVAGTILEIRVKVDEEVAIGETAMVIDEE